MIKFYVLTWLGYGALLFDRSKLFMDVIRFEEFKAGDGEEWG